MYQYTIPVDKITTFLDALDEGKDIILTYKDNAYVILCDIDPKEFDAIEELACVECIVHNEHYFKVQVFNH